MSCQQHRGRQRQDRHSHLVSSRFGELSRTIAHAHHAQRACCLAARARATKLGRGENTMPNDATSPLATYISHLEKGDLAYQFSPAADRAVFFPRVICPFTGSDKLEWRVSKGRGTVYATTIVHPAEG